MDRGPSLLAAAAAGELGNACVGNPLPKAFFARPAAVIAPDLIVCLFLGTRLLRCCSHLFRCYVFSGYVLCMERSGQSRMGVASLAISIVNIITTFILFLIAGVLEASTPGGVDENSAAAVILGFCTIGTVGVNLVSIGLGIAAILQKQRIRICAFIGTSIATASFVATAALVGIGMALDS